MSASLGGIVALVLDALTTLVVVEWAVSWLVLFRVLSESSPLVRGVKKLSDPILDPIRRVIPPRAFSGLDISPAIAIMILQVLAGFARSL